MIKFQRFCFFYTASIKFFYLNIAGIRRNDRFRAYRSDPCVKHAYVIVMHKFILPVFKPCMVTNCEPMRFLSDIHAGLNSNVLYVKTT